MHGRVGAGNREAGSVRRAKGHGRRHGRGGDAPSDVLLIPIEELAPATRDRLTGTAGDVAITRPRSRRSSSLVDANAAGLVEPFRAPSTVVEAILRFSRATNADPRVVLLPSGDDRARVIDGSLRYGDLLGGFTLIDRVSLLEDVEIHRARSADGAFAVLKCARAGHADTLRASLAREAAVLRRLDGRAAPQLLAAELDAPLPYLAMAWCRGITPRRAANELRDAGVDARAALLDLCARIAEAYADLHDRGVLHGDVHDRNALVGIDGSVTLLDFGIAAVADDPSIGFSHRTGVPEYHDPQFADALRRGVRPPMLDALTEQFSLGALLYQVATGQPHLDLSIRRDEALRQIVEEPPLSFSARGVAPWPELEAVLTRALAKGPEDRYPSVRALARALRQLSDTARPATSASSPIASTRAADRRRFVDALVERLEPGGVLFTDGPPVPPLCSVNNGAAGIAYAFYRMAAARDDAILLACAEAWIARARTWRTAPEAWYTNDGVLGAHNLGTTALYHTATGLHCVETLIALAGGDRGRAERCAGEFIAASRGRSTTIDVTLGRAGLVMGATLMLEASPVAWPALVARARTMAASIEKRLTGFGATADEPRLTSVGMAHGWSGLLWMLMRWHGAFGGALPKWIETRLHELAALAMPRGRGLAWNASTDPRLVGPEPDPSPTWCNGASGQMHTWLEAHAAFGGDAYLDLARATAWNVWEDPRNAIVEACCGLVGRAYALLAFYRRTGDASWLDRAQQLADRALAVSTPHAMDAHRLYKGALGLALLLEELESAPDAARMPLFESEGWRRDWR